jgi:fatty-acyl-CoA synthase
VNSTMAESPLLIREILRHGAVVHADSEVVTAEATGVRRATYAQVAARAAQLAHGLEELGITESGRVATFCLNHQEHLEAYLAVPAMGAVLHTINVRLFAEQLQYIINHAKDEVILVDATLADALGAVLSRCPSLRAVIVIGDGDTEVLGSTLAYENVLASQPTSYSWPDLDERSASSICYTSGTTGNPKGVAYSHRSTYLHSLALTSAAGLGITGDDKVLLVVPQFHVNAWGTPYGAWLAGTDLLLPRQFLQAPALAHLIETERPTVAAGVPTIWGDLLRYCDTHEVDLSSLRLIVSGGAPMPEALMDGFEERHHVPVIQAWGMTETSPLGAVATAPRRATPAEARSARLKTGRVVFGVEMRIVDENGRVLPADGRSIGEFEVRGPWITTSYLEDASEERFHDGWLRTGDVGSLDAQGYLQISDRTKDVIKSGGEWISSVELENALMGHPGVREAAVIAVSDPRWGERPLACVVVEEGATLDGAELASYLADKVAKWWIPDRYELLEEIPKTSVGKFDKKVLRARLGGVAVPGVTPAGSSSVGSASVGSSSVGSSSAASATPETAASGASSSDAGVQVTVAMSRTKPVTE